MTRTPEMISSGSTSDANLRLPFGTGRNRLRFVASSFLLLRREKFVASLPELVPIEDLAVY
jgi:hypothetical protein